MQTMTTAEAVRSKRVREDMKALRARLQATVVELRIAADNVRN